MKIINVNTVQGIGDIFWVYQKLSPHFDEINFNIMVTDESNKVQLRSTEFVTMLPKVKKAKFVKVSTSVYGHAATTRFDLNEVIKEHKQKGVCNYAVNRPLEDGVRLEDIDPSFSVEWGVDIKTKPWCLQPFSYGAMYVSGSKPTTVRIWSTDEWVRFACMFYQERNLKDCPLFLVGAEYDRVSIAPLKAELIKYGIDAIEVYTHLTKSLEIIKNSRFFLSYQSGLGILADNFDVPQIMVYFDYLRPMLNTWAKQANIDARVYNGCCFGDEPEQAALTQVAL